MVNIININIYISNNKLNRIISRWFIGIKLLSIRNGRCEKVYRYGRVCRWLLKINRGYGRSFWYLKLVSSYRIWTHEINLRRIKLIIIVTTVTVIKLVAIKLLIVKSNGLWFIHYTSYVSKEINNAIRREILKIINFII